MATVKTQDVEANTWLQPPLDEPWEPHYSEHEGTRASAVAGVLSKYVHFLRGWRERVFVVDNGSVRYYKVHGPHKVNLPGLLQQLRDTSDVSVIGARLGILEEDKKGVNSHKTLEEPHNMVALKECVVQRSEDESRKFYIKVRGGDILWALRAETQLDREAWLDALTTRQGLGSPAYDSSLATASMRAGIVNITLSPNGNFQRMLNQVEHRLKSANTPVETITYIREVLTQQHEQYRQTLSDEMKKRRRTLQYVRQLQEEKRVLETQCVVDAHATGHTQPDESVRMVEYRDTESEDNDGNESNADTGNDEFSDFAAAEQLVTEDGDVYYDASDRHDWEHGRKERLRSHRHDNRAADGLLHSVPYDGSMKRTSSDVLQPPKSAIAAAVPEPEWLSNEVVPKRRTRLPKPAQVEKKLGLWSLIKECIGKDLTRVCLPVYFNEPLSALQKACEEMEYTNLLDEAAKCPAGSVQRLLFVSAFAVAGYASTTGRTTKPFNPLLGETFEFVWPERGCRVIAEKVIHHPTVLALYGEGRGWTMAADSEIRSKFWGRSIELLPVGVIKATFYDGEEFEWHKVTTSIYNLIVGKIYLEHSGIMRVVSNRMDHCMRIRFKESGMFSGRTEKHEVAGALESLSRSHALSSKLAGVTLTGTWDGALCINDGSGDRKVWEKSPPPADPTRYNFSQFAIWLNEVHEGENYAPTDSRLRPDQRYCEQGWYDKANVEKQRLEQKQRAARKAAEMGEPIRPRWFDAVPGADRGKQLSFQYKGGYWESRAAGKFEDCRDIFS